MGELIGTAARAGFSGIWMFEPKSVVKPTENGMTIRIDNKLTTT